MSPTQWAVLSARFEPGGFRARRFFEHADQRGRAGEPKMRSHSGLEKDALFILRHPEFFGLQRQP